MNKLPYAHAADLVNAFKQGTSFRVEGATFASGNGPVKNITSDRRGLRVVMSDEASWTYFQPDGSHRHSTEIRLVLDESLASLQDAKPLLQALCMGETFHCPATRETLVSFEFRKGSLSVTLQPVDGTILDRRTSENYDHNGKHKWSPSRSLVAGPVPKAVKPTVDILVYLYESIAHPGVFNAGTVGQDVGRSYRQVGFGLITAQGKQRG